MGSSPTPDKDSSNKKFNPLRKVQVGSNPNTDLATPSRQPNRNKTSDPKLHQIKCSNKTSTRSTSSQTNQTPEAMTEKKTRTPTTLKKAQCTGTTQMEASKSRRIKGPNLHQQGSLLCKCRNRVPCRSN
jgi:hypothetical protein